MLQPICTRARNFVVLALVLVSSASVAQPVPGTVSTNDLDGTNGFVMEGVEELDHAGRIRWAGDVNGDGFGDLLVGALGVNDFLGAAYVVFGGADFPARFSLADLDGTNGFTIPGGTPGETLEEVEAAGDVNADGMDDFLLGAFDGRAYLVFGRETFPPVLDLATLDGTNGVVLAPSPQAQFVTLSSGDVNGDGMSDILVGSPDTGDALQGEVFVVYGRVDFPAEVDLTSLDGADGYRISGAAADEGTGFSLATGDVNGDRRRDIIVGAPGFIDAFGEVISRVYVVFGSNTPPAAVDLGALAEGEGVVLGSSIVNEFTGQSVASADLNGDGLDEVVIGAPSASTLNPERRGRVYTLFGAPDLPAEVDLLSLGEGIGSIAFGVQTADATGDRVAAGGDINGDGRADLLIGARLVDVPDSGSNGAAHAIFGADSIPAQVPIARAARLRGITLVGAEIADTLTGQDLGDVNGDGIADLLAGASMADPGGRDRAGEAYVLFGRSISAVD